MSESEGRELKGQEHDIKIEETQTQQVKKDKQDKQKRAEQDMKKQQCEEKPHSVVTQEKEQKTHKNQKQEHKSCQNTHHLSESKLALKAELHNMQFEPYLIDQAIQYTSNLDQAIQFIINKIQSNQKQQQQASLPKEVKLFFIVRMDLKMGTGKIAAQVGHAALRAFQNMRYSSSNNDQSAILLIQWIQNGQKNQILQAQTQKDLQFYLNMARNKQINNCYVRDAGRTQIAAGSMTVAAIGPLRQCDASFLKKLKQL